MSVASEAGRPSDAFAEMAQNRWLWAFAAALMAVLMTSAKAPFAVWHLIQDPDDATRLLQVRALLDGAGWYDTRLEQLGLPDSLVSHWSRLIDAPLAASIALLELLVSSRVADTIVRAVWPVVLLVAMMRIAAWSAERQGGTLAALFVLGLAATSGYATFQFMPGRIDHHNVQILGASGGALLLFAAVAASSAQKARGLARGAGLLIGLAIAVGYEAMPLMMAIVALGVAFAAFVPRFLPIFATVLLMMFAVTSAALLVSVHPTDLLDAACDGLGANLVALLGICAGTVTAVSRVGRNWSAPYRLVVLGSGGVVGAIAYAAFNTQCLGGPMAAVDPSIRDIWLAHVTEGMSLADFVEKRPAIAVLYMITMSAAIAIAARGCLRAKTAATLFVLLALVLASAYGTIFAKFFPYAIWMALPTLGVWMSRLPAVGDTPGRTIRMAAFAGLNHVTLTVIGTLLAGVLAPGVQAAAKQEKISFGARQCDDRSDFAQLSWLKDERVFNDINLGALLALETGARVLVAPYHRIDQSIVTWHRIRTSSAVDTEAELRRLGVAYVVLCGAAPTKTPTRLPTAFESYLLAGGQAGYLEPVPLKGLRANLRVWRVLPPK